MDHSYIDLIIRIKNGYMARQDSVECPYSRFKEEIVKKLMRLKFIKEYTIEGEKIKKLMMELLYTENTSPALTDIKVYSKPGRRFYVSYKELKPVLGGLGFSLLSTSKGIMTNKEARKEKLGGELLFSIW